MDKKTAEVIKQLTPEYGKEVAESLAYEGKTAKWPKHRLVEQLTPEYGKEIAESLALDGKTVK